MEGPDAKKIMDFLSEQADGELISWSAQAEMIKSFNLSCFEAEAFIMQNNFLPARYQRNRTMFTIGQQNQLLHNKVAVIGCGGLGGYIIEELARLGVGGIQVVDPDVFVEHNLNRQLLSKIENLGMPKVEAAVQRIKEVNPVIRAFPKQIALSKDNGQEVLGGVDVVIDAMDNVTGRLELGEICNELEVPLVHGAIAGWYGQVLTVFPGEDYLKKVYRNNDADKGIETKLGNPSFTPAVIASIQATEACKALLGEGELLRGRKLVIDLLHMEFEEVPL